MATTKIWAIKDSVKRVIEYARNPEKTEYRECNFKYLHAFGLEQQGKCRKSHGKRGKITRKCANHEQMGELKKPYTTRLFRGSGENFRVLSKAKILGD